MYAIFGCVRFCKKFYHNSEGYSIENSRKSFQISISAAVTSLMKQGKKFMITVRSLYRSNIIQPEETDE
ncbi:hypothetical protein O205_13105 [Bacillus amyloliquefaciens EGD-AQ14]|nr:hypothetical protein O205_13105 [Bacillus amyloliquefaciens EGD-AQ14]BCT26890.1 hypothetical protein BVAD3_05640 [Bacillus velezensis]BCU85279.1 hypothetical protein KOF112_05440 [Bacillus velezensis]